jgi:hypothetical protein
MTESTQIDLQLDAQPEKRPRSESKGSDPDRTLALSRKSTSGLPAHVRKEVDRKVAKHAEKGWKSNFYVLLNTLFTQKWMDVAAEYVQTDVKDALYDEQVQLALITSLVLTMTFPLLFEFSHDWYELATVGFVARQTEHYLGVNIFAEEYMGIWHDISVSGYNLGNACLLCGLLPCLVQLIVLNQIDEEHAITYTQAQGPAAKKITFRLLILGLVLPLAGPMSIRMNATMQTPILFVMHILTGPIVAYVAFSIFRAIKALYVCLDEQEAYDPIVLSEDVIMQHCTEYFEKHPDNYSPSHFCNTLTFVTPKRFKIPLAFSTKLRALKCFFKVLSDREGLDLDMATIGKLSIDMTNNMPVDHEGQEMDLGDDTETNIKGSNTTYVV